MSAIAGVIGRRGQQVTEADLGPVLDELRGLGPDGRGAREAAAGRMRVVVGSCRRRRVPEDEHDDQPVTLGGTTTVGDVILDNREDLVRDLGLGRRRDLSDTAIVAHAYERHGVTCAGHLLGSFAFAVVDPERGGVLLVRDHLGRRPLHVHTTPERVAFSSTALSLTRLDGVDHTLDLDRAREHLALISTDTRSWVVGVDQVPAASARWITASGVRSWRYWQIDPEDIDEAGSFDDHVDALRSALDTATRGRLRTVGGVGVSLSGGLDSTSVAATAARFLAPGVVHTYTSVPPPGWEGPVGGGRVADERAQVLDLAASHPNLRPEFVDARGTSFFDGWDGLFAAGGTPIRNPCNMTWTQRIYEAAAAAGVSLLLTGGLGNLFFSADDPHWLVELLRRRWLRAAQAEVRAWSASTGVPAHGVAGRWIGRELIPASALLWLRARRHQADPIDAWWSTSALRVEQRSGLDLTVGTGMVGPDPMRDMRRYGTVQPARSRAGQAEILAVQGARWGVTDADPTADVRLMETAARQPAWVRRRQGLDRAVARTAMADRLPDSIRLRRARGAQLPDWFDRMTDARAELTEELAATRDHPEARELIDVPRLEASMRSWPDTGRAGDRNVIDDYRLALLRALMVSRYIRWFDEHGHFRG